MKRHLHTITLVICALWCWAPLAQLRALPLWVNAAGGASAAPGDSYVPYVATFDGTNDYMRYSVGVFPTGLADGKAYTFSAHVKMGTSTDGVAYRIFDIADSTGNRFLTVDRTTANKIYGVGRNSDGTIILEYTTDAEALTVATGWAHLYVCFNLDQAVGLNKVYVNGVSQAFTATTYTGGATFDLLSGVTPRYTVGASGATTPTARFKGDMAELWFNDSYLDDLTKFTLANAPITLGANGELPTGSAPVFYFSKAGGGGSWNANAGTGPSMTITGTLDVGTYP